MKRYILEEKDGEVMIVETNVSKKKLKESLSRGVS